MQTLAEMAEAAGFPRKPFYTLTEAAKATGLPYSAMLKASKSGRLKTVLLGDMRGRFVDSDAFAEWMAERTA